MPKFKALKWYFSKFPMEKGKWYLWTKIWPLLRANCFNKGEYETNHGFRMELDPDQYIDFFIYFWGGWELEQVWVINKILRKGDVFVDVGANAGFFTLLAASIVGDEGKVIAFEPVPPVVEKLYSNIKLNNFNSIQLYEKAVADEPGLVKINKIDRFDLARCTIISKHENTREVWEVSKVKLDDILVSERSIRLVKIDVEGAELLVLRGFTDHLTQNDAPFVLCEVTDSFLQKLGSRASDLYQFMAEKGYKYAYDCHCNRLTPIASSPFRKIFQTNILFSKSDLNTKPLSS